VTKRKQRPIDVQDAPWSHIGKDALDAAAERLWNSLRDAGQLHNTRDDDMGPYHVQPTRSQESAQRAVLVILGNTVPELLRAHAKEAYPQGSVEKQALRDLADELEEEHGV
jgi:hypothetical protein